MMRPRVRISTLMLLVVICALAVAVVVDRKRMVELEAQLETKSAFKLGTIKIHAALVTKRIHRPVVPSPSDTSVSQ